MNEVIVIFGKRGSGKTSLAKKLILGRKRLFIFDTLREYKVGLVTNNLNEMMSFLWTHEHRIFRVSYSPEIEEKKAFGYVCQLVYEMRDLTFLVEEVDYFCSAATTPEVLSKIIRYGRHQNISLITTARRTADVPRLLTSQATEFCVFAHHEPRDLDYFSHLFSNEVAEKIKQLKNLQYLHLRPESSKVEVKEIRFKQWKK